MVLLCTKIAGSSLSSRSQDLEEGKRLSSSSRTVSCESESSCITKAEFAGSLQSRAQGIKYKTAEGNATCETN